MSPAKWRPLHHKHVLHPVLEIPTGPPVRGRQLWRRTENFLLIFLQFCVYDLRFKAWGPTTFFTEFQTLVTSQTCTVLVYMFITGMWHFTLQMPVPYIYRTWTLSPLCRQMSQCPAVPGHQQLQRWLTKKLYMSFQSFFGYWTSWIYYTPTSTILKGGVYWFHVCPSVRPSVDKMMSTLYLPQY